MDIYNMIEKIRSKRPLVHHLTNWVTIYDCANIVKVLGASPVMAHAAEESGDMAGLASSLVLNIGTLTPGFVESMKIAAASANKKGIPVILDVCGAGATRLRDEKSFELLDEVRIDVIKGNASEIARIAGEDVRTKGVDSAEVEKDLIELAKGLAVERGATVVITGKEDIAADKNRHFIVKNGHEMMTHVVGTGCMATSVIGTFCAVEKDLTIASAAALAYYGIAAELASGNARGPATFKEKLFDNIYRLDRETVERMQKIQ